MGSTSSAGRTSPTGRTVSTPLLSVRPVGAAATALLPGGPEGANATLPQAGQTLAARVMSVDAGGALLMLAGRLTVRLDAASAHLLAPGQRLSLQVVTSAPGHLSLRRVDTSAEGGGGTLPSAAAAPSFTASAVRRDLAGALTQLGMVVDEPNLLAAQALIRFGVAVTGENLVDVRKSVATKTARLPETAALAKSLNLPFSPAVLRALDTLLGARSDTGLLSVTVPVRTIVGEGAQNADRIAAHLQMATEAATCSVENKLLKGDIDGARADLRAHLLRRAATGTDPDAESAARHLEGQMLVSAARTRSTGEDATATAGSVFVAFVAHAAPGRAHYVEMHVRPASGAGLDDELDDSAATAAPAGAAAALLRIPTVHLGTITARLHLSPGGQLSCQLSSPDPGATRRIERSVSHLEAALTQAGFVNAQARAVPPDVGNAENTPRDDAHRPLRALDLRA